MGRITQYRTTELNIMLIVVGIAMLLISGALMTNAGITLTPTGRSSVTEDLCGTPRHCFGTMSTGCHGVLGHVPPPTHAV